VPADGVLVVSVRVRPVASRHIYACVTLVMVVPSASVWTRVDCCLAM